MPFNAQAVEKSFAVAPSGSTGFNATAVQNAIAVPTPQANAAPPPVANVGHKPPSDIFAPEKALLKPAVGAVGNVMSVLSKSGDVAQSLLAGHPERVVPSLIGHGKQPSLTGGLTPAERDDNVRHVLGGVPEAAVEKLPAGWPQTVGRAVVSGATDPLSYFGGFGFGEKALKAGAEHGLPAAINASDAIGNAAVKIGRKLGGTEGAGKARDPAKRAGNIVASGYSAAVPGGKMKLGLARDFGTLHDKLSNRMFSAKNAGRAQMTAMQNAFTGELHDALKGLTPDEERDVYDAVHFGKASDLPSHLEPAAARLKNLTDSLAHLSGDRELRAHLKENGFELPAYAKPFDRGIRALQRKSQYRRNYVPTAKDGLNLDASPEEMSFLNGGLDEGGKHVENALQYRVDKKAKPAEANLTDAHDPNLERRQEHGELASDPAEQRAIFEARLRAGARAIAGRDTGRRATALFNQLKPTHKLDLGPGGIKDVSAQAGSFSKLPSYVREFFTDKYVPEADKGVMHHIGDAVAGINNANKSAMFISPLRHMMNIATLGTLADPSIGGALQTARTFGQIVRAKPEEKYALLKDAIDNGAVGVPSVDRVTSGTPEGGLPKLLADMSAKTPIVPHVINGVRKLYTMSGNILWSFDDAAKATRYRRLVAKGEHPADAAAQTSAELIDYTNKSEFTNMLRYFAPFATYRSKLPGAIARNIVQHPERALTVNRTAPALAGGYQDGGVGDNGKAQALHSNLPLAEVMRMGDGGRYMGVLPEDYTRSTLGELPKTLGSAGSVFDSDNYPRYLTYGQDVSNPADLAKHALINAVGNTPGVESAMSAYGLSQYPDKGLQGAIGGQLGLALGRLPISDDAIARYLAQPKHHRKTRAEAITALEHPRRY